MYEFHNNFCEIIIFFLRKHETKDVQILVQNCVYHRWIYFVKLAYNIIVYGCMCCVCKVLDKRYC